jgi:hypothetical protein
MANGDERVSVEAQQVAAGEELPQWVPFRAAAVWLLRRDYRFANALAGHSSARIELALSYANWTKCSHTEAAEESFERFRAAYPIPIENEQLTWSLWLTLQPEERETKIEAAKRYGLGLNRIKCHPYAAHRWLERPMSKYEEAQGVLIQGMKDGSIRSTGTPFGLLTVTPFGWPSVASVDRLGCELSPDKIIALELDDDDRLPTVRLVTEDRRAGFKNVHVFGANVARLVRPQGSAHSSSDAEDQYEADGARPPIPAGSIRTGGRPPAVDWQMVKAEVFRLMEHHGKFDPGDREWNCQARLEEAIEGYIRSKWNLELGGSTIRTRVAEALREWRERQEAEN